MKTIGTHMYIHKTNDILCSHIFSCNICMHILYMCTYDILTYIYIHIYIYIWSLFHIGRKKNPIGRRAGKVLKYL
jgi:hypothetical protein